MDQPWGLLKSPVARAAAAHALIWSVAPALLVGNLHQDTLEAAYWGDEPSLAFARHPPLLSLMIRGALGVGHAPIFLLLLMSQVGMAVAAVYVWRAARLYGGPPTAAVAVMLFLISLAATFFAVQVNHNSMLAPFWAATLYYGLSYFERGRGRDAVCLGVAAGLGLLVKYELAVLLACLFLLCLVVRRYRSVFRRGMTYVALVICAAILTPHVLDLLRSGGAAADYALRGHKVVEASGVALSAFNLLVGQFVLFAPPAALLVIVTRVYGVALHRVVWRHEKAVITAMLAFGPSVIMVAAVIATHQVAQPLWALPLASSCAVGLTLLFPCAPAAPRGESLIAGKIVLFSGVAAAAFVAYLYVADAVGAAIGRPLTFYAADSRRLAAAVTEFWDSHARGPVKCVVIAEAALGASTVLWLRSRPRYVDFDHAEWSRPEDVRRCAGTGGVAILTHTRRDELIFNAYPALRTAPRRAFAAPGVFGFSHYQWRADLLLLPPVTASR